MTDLTVISLYISIFSDFTKSVALIGAPQQQKGKFHLFQNEVVSKFLEGEPFYYGAPDSFETTAIETIRSGISQSFGSGLDSEVVKRQSDSMIANIIPHIKSKIREFFTDATIIPSIKPKDYGEKAVGLQSMFSEILTRSQPSQASGPAR